MTINTLAMFVLVPLLATMGCSVAAFAPPHPPLRVSITAPFIASQATMRTPLAAWTFRTKTTTKHQGQLMAKKPLQEERDDDDEDDRGGPVNLF